jgi:hypothetical protein
MIIDIFCQPTDKFRKLLKYVHYSKESYAAETPLVFNKIYDFKNLIITWHYSCIFIDKSIYFMLLFTNLTDCALGHLILEENVLKYFHGKFMIF